MLEALRREVAVRGLEDEVQVTACGSLGLCEHGPNLVVYPEGTWYSGVTAADVPEIVRSHFQEDTPVERLVRTDPAALRAEILNNREKMLAARRAREAAGVLPDELNERIRGFQESRAVLTALELDLFTAVGDGAGAVEVAGKLHADPRATEMLLNALASLRLLVKREGIFHNSPEAARYFTAGSRDNARPALLHTAHLWQRWSTLTDCVRAGTRRGPRRNRRPRPGLDRGLHRRHAPQRLGTRAAGGARGGRGERPPHAGRGRRVGRLFDCFRPGQPRIAGRHPGPGRRRAHRAAPHPGGRRGGPRQGPRRRSAFRPRWAKDTTWCLSPPSATCSAPRRISTCCAAAARRSRRGGRVVIQDFILEADKTAPRFAALFALNMLVGTRGGSSYSEPEYAAWLGEAGFQEIRHVRLPGITGLMIASRA